LPLQKDFSDSEVLQIKASPLTNGWKEGALKTNQSGR